MIGGGLAEKNSKVNVLKTLYKIHRDDVKGPKRVLEKVSNSRFPSVHSKKALLDATVVNNDTLKKNIEKSFSQKGCRLSSVKFIEDER